MAHPPKPGSGQFNRWTRFLHQLFDTAHLPRNLNQNQNPENTLVRGKNQRINFNLKGSIKWGYYSIEGLRLKILFAQTVTDPNTPEICEWKSNVKIWMTAQCQVFFREKNHSNIQHTKIFDLAVAAKVTILKQSFFWIYYFYIFKNTRNTFCLLLFQHVLFRLDFSSEFIRFGA